MTHPSSSPILAPAPHRPRRLVNRFTIFWLAVGVVTAGELRHWLRPHLVRRAGADVIERALRREQRLAGLAAPPEPIAGSVHLMSNAYQLARVAETGGEPERAIEILLTAQRALEQRGLRAFDLVSAAIDRGLASGALPADAAAAAAAELGELLAARPPVVTALAQDFLVVAADVDNLDERVDRIGLARVLRAGGSVRALTARCHVELGSALCDELPVASGHLRRTETSLRKAHDRLVAYAATAPR